MEEVHQRACQQQEVRQGAEDVRGVLGDQEESCDAEKQQQHERRPRSNPRAIAAR
jgi:hypothetical protein